MEGSSSLNEEDLMVLSRTNLFGHLPRESIRKVGVLARARVFERGDAVFHQGDEAHFFCIVAAGWTKVFRFAPNGEEAVLGVFGPGETFAEAAMFLGRRYPASCEAVDRSRLLTIDRAGFEALMAQAPGICTGLLGALSHHLHGMALQVEQLKTRNTEQRVVEFLLKVCKGAGPGAQTVQLPYDKSLIAGRLGMKPESLSRALSKLSSSGVGVSGSEVRIEDIDALRNSLTRGGLRKASSKVKT